MNAKGFTGILTGILIMLLMCIGSGYLISFEAGALNEGVYEEYSPDLNYKYRSECVYDGIIVDLKDFSADDLNNIENNVNAGNFELFIGEVQLAERLNYKYRYKETDNAYYFRSDTCDENYDINFFIRNGLGITRSDEAEAFLKRIYTAYKVYDKEYIYSHAIRFYVDYAEDVPDFYELSDKVVSVSDALVDENGAIYYDVGLDESTDIDFANQFLEDLWEMPIFYNIYDIKLAYEEISCTERIISGKPEKYIFDEGQTEDTTTVPSEPSTTDNESICTSLNTTVATTTIPVLTTNPSVTTTTTMAFVTTTKPATTTVSETANTPSESEITHSPDINGDGTVNMADAVIISSILRGDTEKDSYYIDIADVNNDGVIDEFDYMTVCRNIPGYTVNIKNVTVNISSYNGYGYADCYVKILSSKDLSDTSGCILFQKNVFGKYISIITEDINANGLYCIFNKQYEADYQNKYRLVADIFYDNRRISVEDSCEIV